MPYLFQTYKTRRDKKSGKRIFVLDAKGRKIPHERWRYEFINWKGERVKETGFTSWKKTRDHAIAKEAEHAAMRRGDKPSPDTIIENLNKPFMEAVEEYLSWGDAQGGHKGRPWGKGHSRMRRGQLRWWQGQLELETMGDLKGVLSRAERALYQKQKAGCAGATLERYRESLSSFCKWAVKRKLLADNPIKDFDRFNTDPLIVRRALTVEEIRRLLEVADEPRQLLYLMALCTGLRAGELEALRVYDLDREVKAINLRPEITKNRKPGRQPLPDFLFDRLVDHIKDKRPEDALLQVPTHPARRLRLDMKAANIPRIIQGEGKVDFHSLRVTYTTLVIESGANVKEAQTLARHSDPKLTMNIYAKTRNERLAELVNGVGHRLDEALP